MAKNNNSKVPGIIYFWKRYLIAPKTKTKKASWLEKEQQQQASRREAEAERYTTCVQVGLLEQNRQVLTPHSPKIKMQQGTRLQKHGQIKVSQQAQNDHFEEEDDRKGDFFLMKVDIGLAATNFVGQIALYTVAISLGLDQCWVHFTFLTTPSSHTSLQCCKLFLHKVFKFASVFLNFNLIF